MNNKFCPVCGYEMADGPRSFNICPSCGTEFGLHDENSSIEALRIWWLSTGPRWFSRVVPQPEGWNPTIQLLSGVFLNAHTIVFDEDVLEALNQSRMIAPPRFCWAKAARKKRVNRFVPPGVHSPPYQTILQASA